MRELAPHAYPDALASLRAVPINTLFVQTILRGHLEGRLWADDPLRPAAWYAAHPYGMSLLWGEPACAGFLDAVLEHVLNASGQRRAPEFLQVHPESWADLLEARLGPRLVWSRDLPDPAGPIPEGHGASVLRCTRVNFAFQPEAYRSARAALPPLAPGEEIRPTDASVFADMPGAVVPRHFWRDAAQFLGEGGGRTLWRDGEVAATAFCAFRHGDQFEIGLETDPRHRGRGCARQVACALIDHCLALGAQPVWACRLENQASYHLALKLGFAPTHRLPYYRLAQ